MIWLKKIQISGSSLRRNTLKYMYIWPDTNALKNIAPLLSSPPLTCWINANPSRKNSDFPVFQHLTSIYTYIPTMKQKQFPLENVLAIALDRALTPDDAGQLSLHFKHDHLWYSLQEQPVNQERKHWKRCEV